MNSEPSLAATKRRITGQLVGRDHELELLLAAVDAGRDIVLEGPPGTSKTTMLKAITSAWSIPLLFVEGNADLTPAKLVGHHNPARVLREDYSTGNFVPGPLVDAMESGGFLYIEEFNRAPEDTLNTLLTAMADRTITVPRVGAIAAKPSFRVIASMNPLERRRHHQALNQRARSPVPARRRTSRRPARETADHGWQARCRSCRTR